MGEFGTALKEERKRARKTLKELSEYIKRSVGYISDIEQGRTGPPDIDIVRKCETFLGVEDNRLVMLAEKERSKMPSQMVQDLQDRPQLSDLFFRLKDLPDDELKEWIDKPIGN